MLRPPAEERHLEGTLERFIECLCDLLICRAVLSCFCHSTLAPSLLRDTSTTSVPSLLPAVTVLGRCLRAGPFFLFGNEWPKENPQFLCTVRHTRSRFFFIYSECRHRVNDGKIGFYSPQQLTQKATECGLGKLKYEYPQKNTTQTQPLPWYHSGPLSGP